MKEKGILMFCLFCSIVGLLILFFGVQMMEVNSVKIDEIDEKMIGQSVLISGNITSKYYTGEHMFLRVADETGKIKVVLFENVINKLKIDPNEFRKGDKITVEGRVEKYKGELEIIAENVY